jgi:hypothetical protein
VLGNDPVGQLGDRGAVAHVGDGGACPSADVADDLHGLIEVAGRSQRIRHGGERGRDVTDDDRGARGREGNRVRAALAARPAGHEGDLPGWLLHVVALLPVAAGVAALIKRLLGMIVFQHNARAAGVRYQALA